MYRGHSSRRVQKALAEKQMAKAAGEALTLAASEDSAALQIQKAFPGSAARRQTMQNVELERLHGRSAAEAFARDEDAALRVQRAYRQHSSRRALKADSAVDFEAVVVAQDVEALSEAIGRLNDREKAVRKSKTEARLNLDIFPLSCDFV